MKFGFCLGNEDTESLLHAELDADAFTDAVFRAEGLDPAGDRGLRTLRGQVLRYVSDSFARGGQVPLASDT
ncbi:MAG: hypothetical protein M3P91_00380 [Actinomycetota bacterium]|nr:hypothetical protein [Actinomycetota bacterium]